MFLVYLQVDSYEQGAPLFLSLHEKEENARNKVSYLNNQDLEERPDVKYLVSQFEYPYGINTWAFYEKVEIETKKWS